MQLNELIERYNNSNMTIEDLIDKINYELNLKINKGPIHYFSKDIENNNKKVKPIILKDKDNIFQFVSNKKELFRLEMRKFNMHDTNNSLLRVSLNSSDITFDISNDNYLLGTCGLYSFDRHYNRYSYITIDDNNKVYYEAEVDVDKKAIVKSFFDKDEIIAKHFYLFKNKNIEKFDSEKINKKISSFLKEEFPDLNGIEYERTYNDLVDQFFYDIELTKKNEDYKDLYVTNRSLKFEKIDKDSFVGGVSIKGIFNKNKENFLAISHPAIDKIKLLCVTDFVNGSKMDKSLSNYICLELKRWFYNLDGDVLKDEYSIAQSLREKLFNINKFIIEQADITRKKNSKLRDAKVLGSSIGLALICPTNTYYVNYGDTRIYTQKEQELGSITIDNTQIWDLYMDNKVTTEELLPRLKGSPLTEFVGNKMTFKRLPDLKTLHNCDYDKLFIFSDGVTDNLDPKELVDILDYSSQDKNLRDITFIAHQKQEKFDDVTGCCYVKRKTRN